MRTLVIALTVCWAASAVGHTREEQNKCGVDALKSYTAQKLILLQRDGGEYASTIDGVVASRRLVRGM